MVQKGAESELLAIQRPPLPADGHLTVTVTVMLALP